MTDRKAGANPNASVTKKTAGGIRQGQSVTLLSDGEQWQVVAPAPPEKGVTKPGTFWLHRWRGGGLRDAAGARRRLLDEGLT